MLGARQRGGPVRHRSFFGFCIIMMSAAMPIGGAQRQSVDRPAGALKKMEVVVETRILPIDPVSGIKSKQTVTVDFERGTVSQRYATGSTYGLGSVRDQFTVALARRTGSRIAFRVTGETASGVIVMPNINYRFEIEVAPDGSASLVSGCHDGYPAYAITIGNRKLYSFVHKSIRLIKLFGDCDIRVRRTDLAALR